MPTKRPKNFDPVDCTVDELWTAFAAAPDPVEYAEVHRSLIAQGRTCSYDWVKKKCAALGFAKKKRLQMTVMLVPTAYYISHDNLNYLWFLSPATK